ncbi:MAG TPA: 5'-3' exonuclease H3TH domain-containing protein, partial [Bacteroidia bacterium]|nr:5'-3' exonuclease H3TH domain-containing protein [Bacteroidia bacterium]
MAENNKKLFLLDAFALIYRAYFAFSNNHRVNSKGLNTSAILGFTNTLLEVLKKENPGYIAVVFDTAKPTVRHIEFADYKAHREEMPEDLSKSIPYIIKVIEGFNIPVIFSEGYEADDVIGTLAKKAEQQGFITYMMTPDKDFGQLVSENIFIYKPARMGNGAEKMGIAEVCKKWEIKNVHQLIDILGLMGDKVDNIPGIPGVGEKTAIQLIKDFGSIENLLKNTDKLKGKLKEKVEQNSDKAIQSKWLATIICDVPVEFEPEQLIVKERNKEALKELFSELEFRRLAEQVLGESLFEKNNFSKTENEIITAPKKNNSAQIDLFGHTETVVEKNIVSAEIAEPESKTLETIQTVRHAYHLTDTSVKQADLIQLLSAQKGFCFDTETTGIDAHTAELVGMSFSIKPFEAYYIPIPENKEEAQ